MIRKTWYQNGNFSRPPLTLNWMDWIAISAGNTFSWKGDLFGESRTRHRTIYDISWVKMTFVEYSTSSDFTDWTGASFGVDSTFASNFPSALQVTFGVVLCFMRVCPYRANTLDIDVPNTIMVCDDGMLIWAKLWKLIDMCKFHHPTPEICLFITLQHTPNQKQTNPQPINSQQP
jgi:hypothetical protein